MNNLEGFQGIQPVSEKVNFSFNDKIAIYLKDDGIIIVPRSQISSIQQLRTI